LRGLFVEFVLQADEPEQAAGVVVERDESHFVAMVELFELLDFRGAEFGDMGKKPKPQILGRHVAQEVGIERHVFRSRRPDRDALAAARRLMQFAQAAYLYLDA